MPRIPRKQLKTTFFHVMTQGINKNFIFENPMDIKYYIRIMYQLLEKHNVKIIAYCIMSNHAHMLIEVENIEELSKYMHILNMKYGKYYNKKYNRVGYVFRDRFKSEGIYGEKHLYSCIRYIYNNPVKAGICDYAKDYPYSNYKEILSENDENYVFIDLKEDSDDEICKNVIREFLNENNKDINIIKNSRNALKKLITILKDQHNISLRKIAVEIDINREKIRQIYNS